MSAGDDDEGAGSRRVTPDLYLRATEEFEGLAASLLTKADLREVLQEFADRCARLLGADHVAVRLAMPSGDLSVVASPPEEIRAIEALQAEDAVRSTQVVPLRHGDELLGTVNVFRLATEALDQSAVTVAQGLADMAAYAIVQARALRRATELVTQLQEALSSRIVIEQAKGMLAERLKLDVTEAFAILRHYSRNRSVRISQVAADVLKHRLAVEELVTGARTRTPHGTSASAPSSHSTS